MTTKLAKRPYNHASNIGQNGQPILSENAWDILEALRSGDTPFQPDLKDIPEIVSLIGWAKDLHEALLKVARLAKGYTATQPLRLVEWAQRTGSAPTTKDEALEKLLELVHSNAFAANPLHWLFAAKQPATPNEAIATIAETISTQSLDQAYWAMPLPIGPADALNRLAAAIYAANGSVKV